MNPLKNAVALFTWIFVRLPLLFSIPFSGLSLWWIFGGFRRLNDAVAVPASDLVASIIGSKLPQAGRDFVILNLGAFFHAAITILLFALGFLVAYNVSALINVIGLRLKAKPERFVAGPPITPSALADSTTPFSKVNKIGIVLAGGGAKGSFQAGSMKAIYNYLSKHGALGKVKVIAGTSIGSWNGLFWLADLVHSGAGQQSVHEKWWRSISLKALASPIWYVPFFRNAFLDTEPWRLAFDHIFGQTSVRDHMAKSAVHFYLTRSNVGSGHIECATNNPSPPSIANVSYEVLDPSGPPEQFSEGIKAGVFASMDLPPLFPYVSRGTNWFEDGGVIDNLPIIFAASEDCDLLFILPLNANFEQEPNTVSITARLFRVMDVRQGALERNGFKMIYLYNELAALRQLVAAHADPSDSARPHLSAPLQSALERKNGLINVFAVCPEKPFVQSTINTQELWKSKEAGIAFDVMYKATSEILDAFPFDKTSDLIRVALVSRQGTVTWDENF
jgi:predicted acylesterase/phospholipase RssA